MDAIAIPNKLFAISQTLSPSYRRVEEAEFGLLIVYLVLRMLLVWLFWTKAARIAGWLEGQNNSPIVDVGAAPIPHP